jgi:hypothetical protein
LPQGRSGMSRPVVGSEHGWTITARGRGQVLVKLTSERQGDEKWSMFTVPLPGDTQKAMRFTALWDGGHFRLRNSKDSEVGREVFAATPTKFTIEADDEVILTALPTPATFE